MMESYNCNESSVPADLFALPVAAMFPPSQYLLTFPFLIPSLSSPPLPPPLSHVQGEYGGGVC